MIIRLLAVGNKMPDWVNTGYQEFAKRLPTGYKLQLVEIPPEKRTKQCNTSRIIELESEKIVTALKPGNRVIALAVEGQAFTTPQLASHLQKWHDASQDIDLLIGGPDGLSSNCLDLATLKWSLSPLTLPHPLVRILVAEQLYRAWSILQNHPYHR